MAAEVQPVPPVKGPVGPAPLTADQAYWRSFKNQLQIPSPHNSAITSVTTSGSENFAVTSGARIQLFNSKTRKLVKTISRFNVDDTARSGVLRRDGRILLAAGDSGVIQAFDTGSRAILRQWQRETGTGGKRKQAVHVARWHPSKMTEFMTCSDDQTVKVWDLTEEEPRWTGVGHQDYVRCGCWLPGKGIEGMVVTGSYDQTVRVWDTRTAQNNASTSGRAAMVFKLPAAVEAVLPLSDGMVAAAAGSSVTLLNLIAGKAEVVLHSHQKTITALALAQNGSRLLTAGLDGFVKVHDTSTWEVVASIKYPAPILSLAVIPSSASGVEGGDDRHLAVGLQTGLLSLKTRLAGTEKVKQRQREQKMTALLEGTADEFERKQREKDLRQGIRARDRGKDYRGEGADIVIMGNDRAKVKKMNPWQISLRKGRYAQALDQTLLPDGGAAAFDNEAVLTLLTALRHRSDTLRSALANRSEAQLLPVLQWVLRYINHPRHLQIVNDVLLVLLDLYSHRMEDWMSDDGGDGKACFMLVRRIHKRVNKAKADAQDAETMVGALEMLGAG